MVCGSSPLTRGKLPVLGLQLSGPGLIPAHAGKTPYRAPTSPGLRAHPRSRGENEEQLFEYLDTAGSSPLTRGKRAAAHAGPPDLRLIPAHAGKTDAGHLARRAPWAHPRSRGENYLRQ